MTKIPDPYDCPVCESETRGHAVPDISRVLCRDCFHIWIMRADGSTLEDRIAACEELPLTVSVSETAERMRARHVLREFSGGDQ